MAEKHAKIRVDLDALGGSLQSSIQLAIQRASFSLKAGRQANDADLELPDTQFNIRFGQPTATNPKLDHENWTLASALRDCAEAFNTFLDRCREVCAVYSFGKSGSISGADWQRAMKNEGQKFHFLGLARKLEWLHAKYGLTIDSDIEADLLSINAARNCLVHRHGVVQEADKNTNDGLRVQWTRPALKVEGKLGSHPLVLGDTVNAGERIVFAQEKASKVFAVGQRVEFGVQEFSDLCWTYYIACLRIVEAVKNFGEAMGIKHREPTAAEQRP